MGKYNLREKDKYQSLLMKFRAVLSLKNYEKSKEFLGELTGTAILLIYGSGVLSQVILGSNGSHEHGSFISISLTWGMAVMMGVYFSSRSGKGLINPAVTLAFAIIGKIKFKRVLLYSVAQLLGAFIGALLVYIINFEKFEEMAKLDNGRYMMNRTGGVFVTRPSISHGGAFLDQIFGTALLSSGALAIIDERVWTLPTFLHPVCIGMLVFTIVSCFAMNAGAALNPARDFGPRLMMSIMGWGLDAFRDSDYYFWVPIFGPYIGATVGAVLYELLIGIHLEKPEPLPITAKNPDTNQDIILSKVNI